MNVDEFVENKVLPQFRDIVAAIRGHVRTHFPELKEEISYGILAFRRKRIVAVVSPTKKGVTLAFSRGAEFKDVLGLLEGVGMKSKNLRMRSIEEFDEKALSYYMSQAVTCDEKAE